MGLVPDGGALMVGNHSGGNVTPDTQIKSIVPVREFRDDRFSAAIDRAAKDKSVFTVAYVVRAVSPGKYVLPQAYVEDMYNPSRYGRTGTGSVEVRAAK